MNLVFGLTRFLFLALLILSIILLSVWLYLNPLPHRQQLFLNGTILTMDSDNTVAEALLVEEGRILATGSKEEMDELSSFDAVIVDLEGQTLVPGFIEAHGHFSASKTIAQKDENGDNNILTILSDNIGQYLVQGVTTVQNGDTSPALFVPLSALTLSGLIPQRIVFWPNEKLARQLMAGEFIGLEEGIDTNKITTSAVKIFVDGSLKRYESYLSKPYIQLGANHKESFKGSPLIKADELNKKVAYWHSSGWQIAIHANGDAAIKMALNAIELAQQKAPRENTRHIIVHAQMATDKQLNRMSMLGVSPSFYSAQIFYSGDVLYRSYLGKERSIALNPLKSAENHQLRYSIHSDTPESPIEPMRLISYAVDRQTEEGRILGHDEKISALQALKAVTIDAAWQIFREHDLGSVEPGKLADFVVLSDNPLDSADSLGDIEVMQTWIGGVKRFERTTVRKSD